MSNPPFTVRSVFEYASGHDDDLSFPIGQIVTVTAVEDDDWYYGEYTDGSGNKQEGIFPKNFVERYEPPAPPRPTRPSRPKKEPEPAPVEYPVAVTERQPQPEPEVAEQPAVEEQEPVSKQPPPQSPPAASSPVAETPSSPKLPPQAAKSAPAPPPVAKSSKPPPPAVAEKPSGSSFKDRIAAFNQSAAAPIAPFKPGGPQSTSFVKKQFVAPPPSKDSFVAPPREPALKVYRREEDPDVKEQLAREPPVSETRPPPPAPVNAQGSEEGAEDQPKPTSLKDRIALLQKQQLEQAQRHAEAAQRKEKPKPPKKPVEQPSEPVEGEEEPETSPVEPVGTTRDHSVDTLRAKVPPAEPTPFSPFEGIASESNDADYSGAADSEDAGETSTSKDEEEERPRQQSTHTIEQNGEEADVEEEGEEEEEEELDPETKRRMELRARMAKMSGGMGMMGLFGPPGGLPGMAPPTGSRKPKTPGESEKRLAEPEPTSPRHAPPVPLPGMHISTKPPAVEHEEEEPVATPISEQHPPRQVPDVEEVVHEGVPPRRSTDRPPPLPPTGKLFRFACTRNTKSLQVLNRTLRSTASSAS